MASVTKAMALALVTLLLASTAHAQLHCAPHGAVLCGSSGDVATINSAKYARDLSEAGAHTFILGIGGAEALQEVIGDVLSPGCLSCQGAMLDCSAKQVQCFEACAESTCGRACRRCMEEACPVQKACGGVPGETLQYPFTCANPSDSDSLAIDKSLLNCPFTGSCSASLSSAVPPVPSKDKAAAVTGGAAVDSINIPIRPRAEEVAGDAKADSINIPIRPRGEAVKGDTRADSINIPIRPRGEEVGGGAKADSINIPIRPRAEEVTAVAKAESISIPVKPRVEDPAPAPEPEPVDEAGDEKAAIKHPLRPRDEEVEGGAKADSINIPIRPRAEEATAVAKAESINIPVKPRAEDPAPAPEPEPVDEAGDEKAAIKHPLRPRDEEVEGGAKADSINIPIRPRAEEATAGAKAESIPPPVKPRAEDPGAAGHANAATTHPLRPRAEEVEGGAKADSINIPIRPRAEEATAVAKAESINIPVKPRAEDPAPAPEPEPVDEAGDEKAAIKHPLRPRDEEVKGGAKADSINIPIRPRAEETTGNANVASIDKPRADEDGSAIVIPIKNQSIPEEDAGNIFIASQPKHPRAAWSTIGASTDPVVSAQMTCAPAGQAYCESREDMSVIDNAHFAASLTAAASEVFINQMPGAQALEGVIGTGRMSGRCLACQGASLDCAVQQSQCFQFCAESSCSAECRSCIQQKCDTAKACGGAPGVSIQNPYTCINNDPNSFYVNRDLLNLPFTGQCSRRLEIDRTEVIV